MFLKRILPWLLAACCVLTLLPLPSAGAETHAQLKDIIASQYDAYASTLSYANATDDAVEQLINHAIYGKHKKLNLDASDPLTVSVLNSNMFREAVINGVAYGLEAMEMDGTDRVLLTTGFNWYDYGCHYQLSEAVYNETSNLDDDTVRNTLSNNTISADFLNGNDQAMILVVGSASGRIRLNRDASDPNRYLVRVELYDNFDFNKNMTNSLKNFGSSVSALISLVGPLLGFKSFEWSATAEFAVTLPTLCPHESGCYRFETKNGELTAVSGGDLLKTPLHKHTISTEDGENLFYYELETPVHLRHWDPWVIEFRYKGQEPLQISALETIGAGRTYFLRKSEYLFAGQAFYDEAYDTNNKRNRHHYGVVTKEFSASQWHTFRIENRLTEEGTNMLWLLIDGQEMGPLVDHYIQKNNGKEVAQGNQGNWVSGKDFTVRYIGNQSYPLRGEMEYLALWQNGEAVQTDTVEPTCSQPGKRTETCKLCGVTYLREEIPALGHDLQIVPGKEATCEAPGLTNGNACSRCGEIVTEAQVIPALGHDPEEVPGAAPDCVTSGWTEGQICGVCQKVLVPQNSIPALGHQYENGLCAACGTKDPSRIPGDANGDGIANFEDALLILRVSINLEPQSPVYLLFCDMNADGMLSYADALIILRASIGI